MPHPQRLVNGLDEDRDEGCLQSFTQPDIPRLHA